MTTASTRTQFSSTRVAVVIPNWNGKDELPACLDSLAKQTIEHEVVVVENGSTDNSADIVKTHYPYVTLLRQAKNLGFAGGVNVGIRYALEKGYTYVALFNNDAVAELYWLEELVEALDAHPQAGIATCKFMSIDKKHLDSTGDMYTTWGLPYPRGRGEQVSDAYDRLTELFGASGGASIYRAAMLQEIGLFDEDFFAYYEDVDLSFRAQLAGWKVIYEPQAQAYHHIGATSSKTKGFTTYQTIKNCPWILIKDVPLALLPMILPRFALAQVLFFGRAVIRGHGWYAIKGLAVCLYKTPKKCIERRKIQHMKRVTDVYIKSQLTWDLPPNARNLRKLRSWWRGVKGSKETT
jgi:GT2 family glycosyltransferase